MQGFAAVEVRLATLAKSFFDDRQILYPLLASFRIGTRRQIGTVLGRVASLECIVSRAEIATAPRALARENGDVGRNFDFWIGQFVADNGADGRVNHGRTRTVAGLYVIRGALMVALEAGHRTDQRHVGRSVRRAFEASR